MLKLIKLMTPEKQREAIDAIRRALSGRQKPVKVLLVEDHLADAEMTVSRMQQYGLNVTWVQSPQEVQDYLKENDPWLVFLDMKLGKVSGLIILNLILLLRPDTRVVILTGAYDHDSAECVLAMSRGATAVMLKPLTEQQIELIFLAP